MPEADICALADLPPGSVTAGEVDGQRVCVANLDGELFAVQDRCPHLAAPLSVGHLDHSNIVCPWHDSEFDLRTGETKKVAPQRSLARPRPESAPAPTRPRKVA